MFKIFVLNILFSFLFLFTSCNPQNVGKEQVEIQDGTIAALSFSTGSAIDFGSLLYQNVYEKTVTISNGGSLSAFNITIPDLAIPYSFKGGGAYPGEGGNCGTTLVKGQSCTIVVVFTPDAVADYNKTISVSYNNGVDQVVDQRPLTGRGVDVALLDISAGPDYTDVLLDVADLGTIMTFSQASKTFRVTNVGGLAASFTSIGAVVAPYSFTGGSYPGSGGSCGGAGYTLVEGQSCYISNTFAPTIGGNYANAIIINYDDGQSIQTATKTMNGEGLDDSALVSYAGADLLPYDFGNKVVDSAVGYDYDLVIENRGPRAATAVTIVMNTADEYTCKTNCALTTLEAFTSYTITVNFKPTTPRLYDDQVGTLRIDYNDNHSISPQAKFAEFGVTGNGIAPAKMELVVNPLQPLDFGQTEIGLTGTRFFSLINNGGGAATTWSAAQDFVASVNAPFILDAMMSDCDNEDMIVAPNMTCTLVVRYEPTLVQSDNSLISFTYDNGLDPVAADLAETVLGEGVEQAHMKFYRWNDANSTYIRIYNSMTDQFPVTLNDGHSVYTYKLENDGTGIGTIVNFAIQDEGTPYILTDGNGCTTGAKTYAPAESCTFTVDFNPVDADPNHEETYSKSVDFNWFDGVDVVAQSDSFNFQGTMSLAGNVDFQDLLDVTLGEPFALTDVSAGLESITVIRLKSSNDDPIIVSSYAVSGPGAANVEIVERDNFIDMQACTVPLLTPVTYYKDTYCNLYVKFTAPVGDGDGTIYNANIDITYDNMIQADNVESLPITAEVKHRAVLRWEDITNVVTEVDQDPDQYQQPDTGVGEISDTVYRVHNDGKLDATGITLSVVTAPYIYQVPLPCVTIVAGASCDFTLRFSPVVRESTPGNNAWNQVITVDYDDGVEAGPVQFTYNLMTRAVNPAELVIRENSGSTYLTDFDFEQIPEGLDMTYTFVIENIGEVDARNVVFAPPAAPFSITSNSCTDTITKVGSGISSRCSIAIEFYPTAMLVYNDTLDITYDSINSPFALNLAGEGIDPVADFYGWEQIFSASDVSKSTITLAWDAADVPDPYVVSFYRIYRSKNVALDIASIDNDVVTPHRITANKTITDTNLDLGTVYYYTVRPVVMNGPQEVQMKVVDAFGVLKIMTPPMNMGLVHRWAANRAICSTMGYEVKTPTTGICQDMTIGDENSCIVAGLLWNDTLGLCEDVPNNNEEDCLTATRTWIPGRCSDPIWSGLTACLTAGEHWASPQGYMDGDDNFKCTGSSTYDTYDIGRHSYVDRYELSADGNKYGEYPLISQTHFTALTNCQVYYGDVDGLQYQKRTLTRSEQFVAMMETDKTQCNISSGELQFVGESPACISRFGISDMVGNLWEWTLDRIYNNQGIDNSDLPLDDIYNSSMTDVRITHGTALVSDVACYALAIGLPMAEIGGVCPEGSSRINELMIPAATISTDFYYSTRVGGSTLGGRGMVAGGAYNSGNLGGPWGVDLRRTPGSTTLQFGTRCGFSVEE